MRIADPIMKHGLSEIINSVQKSYRAELIEQIASNKRQVFTKKQVIEILIGKVKMELEGGE